MTSYQLHDLLVVIGQQTVDLALARGRITELEQRIAELERSPNGRAEVVEYADAG